MNYYIYLIRNKLNNKIYIGKRKCPSNETPLSDKYMGSGKILKYAYKKYGVENFEKKILVENIDSGELINSLEKEFIAKFDSTNKAKGYNRTSGGDGGHTTRFFSEEELEIYKNKFRNRFYSEETKQKLREKVNISAVKKNLEKARENFKKLVDSGWKQEYSEETRRLMSLKSKTSHNKKVLCITTNIIYSSMSEAAEKTNSSLSKISMCCNRKRNKTNNLKWKFLEEKVSK